MRLKECRHFYDHWCLCNGVGEGPASRPVQQLTPCHPACKCREKKWEEWVAMLKRHFPVGVPHDSTCSKCSPFEYGSCTCSADELQAAIEGVRS